MQLQRIFLAGPKITLPPHTPSHAALASPAPPSGGRGHVWLSVPPPRTCPRPTAGNGAATTKNSSGKSYACHGVT